MTLPRQNSNTMSSRFKQNKPLLSRQPLNKNEISSSNLIKSNLKSDNDIMKKELKLCSQVWAKLLKLPLIKYLEKKHHPNVHLDTTILNEITLVYEKINKEEYTGKDEFYSLVMDIINKFGLICKPTTQVYMDYNNLKLIFNTEWNKCLNIIKLNKEFITSPKMNKIICHICKEEFKLKRDFKNHLKTCSINNPKSSIKNEENKININNNNNNKIVIPSTSFSSPPPNVKYKYEKKDTQKNEKKELSISYKLYSKFFKPEFNMEAIKIGDSIDCPFNNCTGTSSSLAKLVTHIMTNHQDKLTVISDYYCSVCGKRLPDIVTLIIHNVEHQHNKRRKIFSKDHTTNPTSSSSSLINPLNPISNSFIPINTSVTKSSLSLPHTNTKNIKDKSINSKSSKLKRKHPFDNSNNPNNTSNISNTNLSKTNNIILDTNQNKNQENENYPLTPSPTSSLSQNLQTSPTKINNVGIEDQSKENNLSLNNNNFNIKDIEKGKELKNNVDDVLKENSSDMVLENTLENKLKKNISEKVQLQLDQTNNNLLQLKSSNKIPNNNNIPSPISSPISHKINTQHIKDNTILSSPNTSHSKSESSSSTVSYTRSKLRIPCVVKTCKKTYKNIKGLKTHISRYHPEVQVNIEELVASYKIQSEQEELKENKKVHNILPVTTSSHLNMNASTSTNLNINLNINKNENPKNNNKSNNVNNSNINNNSASTSNSNLLSIENNPLLNIPSDTMNIDKPLSSDLLNNLIKGKNIPNEIEDDKKGKLNTLDNSMNIDANNMNIKSTISNSNNLNLLQDYLINNNTLNNTELGNLENLNLNTANPYSYLDTNLNMSIGLQNNLLFNNTLSQTGNPIDILKNPSLIPELNKPDLLSTMCPPPSNDLLSNNITNNISNNLLMNLLYNNIDNSTLPMNNINDLNLLNMNYNPLNSFSLYDTNVDSLNSLNNTQLQLLLNNHNHNNNSDNNNASGESNDHKTNSLNLNSKESFNTTTTDSHNKHSNEVSSNSNISISEKLLDHNKNKDKLKEVISPISNKNTNNTSNKQDNHPETSSINSEILNNIFINENNLNDSNLDLVNLNTSISDSKSLDLVNLNSSISDPKSLDLLSNTLIPDLKDIDIKASINETLDELNLKQSKNIDDNEKK